HHHQQRRFSTAARADQHRKPARLNLEGDVGQRDDILARRAIGLADAVDLDRARARDELERRYVRQWLHRVSTHLTSSLNVMAIAEISKTPASNCGIWKFSPQVSI